MSTDREALRTILTEILHSLDGRTEPVPPLMSQWVAEQARRGLGILAALAPAGERATKVEAALPPAPEREP